MSACPYCCAPDRDVVLDDVAQCQWVEDTRISQGADPPCTTDLYACYEYYRRTTWRYRFPRWVKRVWRMK